MTQRIDYGRVAPEGLAAMLGLEKYARGSGLEHGLLELVKTRASQLNACAYCLDMHTKDARAAGESEQRLYALAAWREAPFFSAASTKSWLSTWPPKGARPRSSGRPALSAKAFVRIAALWPQ